MTPSVQIPTLLEYRPHRMATNQGYHYHRPPGAKSVLDAGKRYAVEGNYDTTRPHLLFHRLLRWMVLIVGPVRILWMFDF